MPHDLTPMSVGWFPNYFNTVPRHHRFENRNFLRYNLRMFTGIFEAYNRQKDENIQRQPEKTTFF